VRAQIFHFLLDLTDKESLFTFQYGKI